MNGYSYKFTFEDGSEAFAHYGVKGMKWNKHEMAQDPAYLQSLGMAVPGAEFNPLNAAQEAAKNVQNAAGQAAENAKKAVTGAADQVNKTAGNASHNLSMVLQNLTNPRKTVKGTMSTGDKEHHTYREQMPNGRRRSWSETKKPQTFEQFKEKVRKEEAKSPVNRLRNLLGDAEKAVDNAGKAASKAVSDTITKHGTHSTTAKSTDTKQSASGKIGRTVDGEYQREKAYNSRKNSYPPTAGNDADMARKMNEMRARVGVNSVKNHTERPMDIASNVIDYGVYTAKELKKNTASTQGSSKTSSSKNTGRTVDGEYQREKAYNSRRNEYKSASRNTSSPSKRKQRGHFTVKNGKTVYVRG